MAPEIDRGRRERDLPSDRSLPGAATPAAPHRRRRRRAANNSVTLTLPIILLIYIQIRPLPHPLQTNRNDLICNSHHWPIPKMAIYNFKFAI